MNVNTDINVLGSIVDLKLIANILNAGKKDTTANTVFTTKVKTIKSLQRYESAIKNTILTFKNEQVKELLETIFVNEGLSEICLTMLFLNASFNNELLNYLNQNVFFPAYFSGRISINKDEVIACINDLKQNQDAIKKWTESTINVTASKYLSFLGKFLLLEKGHKKVIKHKYLDDKQLVLFVYWLIKTEAKSNKLSSKWLYYCFLEEETFKQRILQKNLIKYIDVIYTGDTMKLEAKIPYKDIYHELA